jgi:hypothetical protein
MVTKNNILKLTLSSYDDVVIVHNDVLLDLTNCKNTCTITDCLDYNTLVIKNFSKSTVEIIHLSMFDIGVEKLKYLGIITNNNNTYNGHIIDPNCSWKLSYEYPVFRWLHLNLNLGWIIDFDQNTGS